MSPAVRVLLFHRCGNAGAIVDAYREVSETLAAVPGLLGNELIRSVSEPDIFVVISTWRDMATFQAWEQGMGHRDDTAPLRPYRDLSLRRPFDIFQVVDDFQAKRERADVVSDSPA